jgi:hypothetical protein
VILDNTDAYVFCYACGLRMPYYQVWRWAGSAWEMVRLSDLPDTAPAEVRDLNNRAVELVGGGFWQEGQAMIAEAAAQAPEEPSVIWNKLLIDLKAEALGSQLYPDAYPLIS